MREYNIVAKGESAICTDAGKALTDVSQLYCPESKVMLTGENVTLDWYT